MLSDVPVFYFLVNSFSHNFGIINTTWNCVKVIVTRQVIKMRTITMIIIIILVAFVLWEWYRNVCRLLWPLNYDMHYQYNFFVHTSVANETRMISQKKVLKKGPKTEIKQLSYYLLSYFRNMDELIIFFIIFFLSISIHFLFCSWNKKI